MEKLTLDNLTKLREKLTALPHRFADFTAGYQYMWSEMYDTQLGQLCGVPVLSVRETDKSRRYAFLAPLPAEREAELLSALCKENGGSVTVGALTEEEAVAYAKLFPGESQIAAFPEESDYLYTAESLSSFKGRHLAAKRNHINAFLREQSNYAVLPLTQENLPEVQAFHAAFQRESQDRSESALREERAATRLLAAFPQSSDLGIVLYVRNRVAGFSLGEVRGDTFYMHVEKADCTVRGAYPLLTREAVSLACGRGAVYVNREEDDGDPGLRQAKRSLCPVALLDKYTLYLKL